MKKFLAVCGLGQGTSLILRMNIENVLREHGIEAEVENTDLSAASGQEADYIITSQELAESLQNHQAQVVIVKDFFNQDQIREALQEQGVL